MLKTLALRSILLKAAVGGQRIYMKEKDISGSLTCCLVKNQEEYDKMPGHQEGKRAHARYSLSKNGIVIMASLADWRGFS
jgi:hypothetical protein